jgi:uncharacterized membrane protein YebE (DUF533 family)
MTKQTKTILGLAVLAGVGYYGYNQWKKNQPAKTGFANVMGKDTMLRGCPCKEKTGAKTKKPDGTVLEECRGQQWCPSEGPYQPY